MEEALIGKRLQPSRHFAKIHDVFFDPDLHDAKGGLLVTVMELIHGFDLEELFDTYLSTQTTSCGDGFLPWEIAFSILLQALQGLEDAQFLQHTSHGAFTSLVHRDLKPTNLMISFDGIVKILDLGLAKYDQRHPLLHTQHGPSRRCSVFAAPEQITQQHPTSVLSDLFSLGAILYLLTTRCTLSGTLDPAHHAQWIGRYRAKNLRPQERNPALPDSAARAILALLAEDPQQRPQTPQAARHLLWETLVCERKLLWTPAHLQRWLRELFGHIGQKHRPHALPFAFAEVDSLDNTALEEAYSKQAAARSIPDYSPSPCPSPCPIHPPNRRSQTRRTLDFLWVGLLSALGTLALLFGLFGFTASK